MKDLSCLTTIVKDGLAAYIDISDLKSWNLNTGYTTISLTKWSKAISDNISLYDFGLTSFDNGRVDKMSDTLDLTSNDNKLSLYRIGFNNPTGGTFYTDYTITPVTGETIGNYFNLDGGYLQGFFKLKDYNYEILPARYKNGVSIETLLRVSDSSFNNGMFLMLGARAEDKYVQEFSGETVYLTDGTASGVTTSLDNHLLSNKEIEVVKAAINDENHTEVKLEKNTTQNLSSNVIGFYLSSTRKIGYKKINGLNIIETNESEKTLDNGWNLINITFNPYEKLADDLLTCTPFRLGDLIVYVNGRRFWKIEDFDEFYFSGFDNSKEKQLGVPYSLSWGGGSFGLKHSYHWDLNKRDVSLLPSSGFTFINNPNISYECPPAPVSATTSNINVSGNTTLFTIVDECDGSTTSLPVLRLQLSGDTSGNTFNQYYLQYNTDLTLISNRDYTFSVDVRELGIFEPSSTFEIGMFFYGADDIEILYKKSYTSDIAVSNEWFKIVYKIKLKKNSGVDTIKAGFFIKSDLDVINNSTVYFANFSFIGSDRLVQDGRKQDLIIEKEFDSSFIGDIQKLRIYDRPLSPAEILHNAKIDFTNVDYNITISTGGRQIYV